MSKFATAFVAVFLCAEPASAEFILPLPHICFEAAEGKKFLERSGELVGQGLMSDKILVQMLVKKDGQYVIAFLNGAGRVCIAAIGTEWIKEVAVPKGG